MNATRRIIGVVLLSALAAIGADAQVRRVGQTNSPTVRQLIRRIEDRIDLLRNSLGNTTDRSPVYNTRGEENASVLLTNFDDAVQRMHERFNRREATADDAQEVLNAATPLDNLIRRNTVNAQTQRYWTNLRVDLNELARVYGLTWPNASRSYRTYPTTPATVPAYSTARLTGTYRLDSSSSEDPGIAVDRVLRSLPYQERQQRRDQLLRRLEPPEQIAIDVRGRTITLASTRAPQVSFEADGRDRVETMSNGRTIQVRTTLTGDQLTVTTTGDRNNQFNVTFNAIDGGRRLRVVRRVYADNLNTPIEIQSFYDKTAEVAQFNIYGGSQDSPTTENTEDYILRSGETVVAELNDPLSTATGRDGEQFTATVRLPEQYAGATIEGHVSNVQRSGRVTGRSEMTFNFDRIRLRDGRSYRFAGIVQTVRTPNGDTAKIDNEGAIQDDNQSKKTVERTAIGTAVGAIIGAIAGGGKGAAIGAVLGAGGGAGSVYIQGRDDLELPRGTEVTIQVTGPNR